MESEKKKEGTRRERGEIAGVAWRLARPPAALSRPARPPALRPCSPVCPRSCSTSVASSNNDSFGVDISSDGVVVVTSPLFGRRRSLVPVGRGGARI
jgi:hypothetical protein